MARITPDGALCRLCQHPSSIMGSTAAMPASPARALFGRRSPGVVPEASRELLFVVLAGSPGAAALRAWRGWRQPGGTTTRPTTSRSAPPRWQRATRLARRATRSGCGDLSDAPGRAALVGWVAAREWSSRSSFPTGRHTWSAATAAGGRGRGPRDRDPRRRSSDSVRGGRGPATGACWACRGRASPGHGSRMAAASVSVARKRRHADRAGGDGW